MLGLLTAKASAKHSQKETSKWEGTLLETSFIELDENPEYVQQTATQVPAVSKWLREDRLFGGTVYMITGIKTAIKPGKATYAAVTERDIAAKLEATLALDPGTGGVPTAKIGAEAGYNTAGDIDLQGTPQDSFVFAYQLRKLHIRWYPKLYSLEEHLGGADLHSAGDSNILRERLRSQAEKAADYEIGDVKYEADDFGALLPKKDVKVNGVDDCDGEQCLMIQANMLTLERERGMHLKGCFVKEFPFPHQSTTLEICG